MYRKKSKKVRKKSKKVRKKSKKVRKKSRKPRKKSRKKSKKPRKKSKKPRKKSRKPRKKSRKPRKKSRKRSRKRYHSQNTVTCGPHPGGSYCKECLWRSLTGENVETQFVGSPGATRGHRLLTMPSEITRAKLDEYRNFLASKRQGENKYYDALKRVGRWREKSLKAQHTHNRLVKKARERRKLLKIRQRESLELAPSMQPLIGHLGGRRTPLGIIDE